MTTKRPKIAAVATIYHKYSHAQHIVDRFLEGYGWNSRHHRPPMDLVSLYVDQVNENDLSRERAERFPSLKIYPTVAETLTLGGSELAVDGVLLVGEHGDYPTNEKGQRLYPRYELFKEIVAVFKASGKTASIFNDKHLSWKWEWYSRPPLPPYQLLGKWEWHSRPPLPLCQLSGKWEWHSRPPLPPPQKWEWHSRPPLPLSSEGERLKGEGLR